MAENIAGLTEANPAPTWHKKKYVAILLAVFLGPWTWLYTLEMDIVKYIVGVGLNLNILGLFIIWFIGINRMPLGEDMWAYVFQIGFVGLIWLVLLFLTWVFAVGDSAWGDKWKSTKSQSKNKTTALYLAVFLGYWTWLYTYSKDRWKFWLGLVLFWGTIASNALVRLPGESYLAIMIIWITAIIDTVRKPDAWFDTLNIKPTSSFVRPESS